MASANDWLADEAVARSVWLTHYSNGVVRRLLAILNRVDASLFAQLESALLQMDARSWSVERLEQLLGSVRLINAQVYQQFLEAMQPDLRGVTESELAFQRRTITQPLPVQVAARFNAVSIEQVHAAAMARPFQGKLLTEFARSLEADKMARIRERVRMGYVEGKTVSQMVREIRGTRAKAFSDGIIEIDRRNAEAVIRTAVSHTAGFARAQVMEANTDLIKAVAWRSTLDTSTTQMCRIRDGLQYTVGTHKPIGHSVPYLAGPGRLHWCCRSTESPVLKSWKELGGADVADWTPSQRASMDGAVPADLKYSDWLKRQSAARQDEVLGVTRGRLYRKGDLPLSAFSNNKGQIITLAELKQREPRAFELAGV